MSAAKARHDADRAQMEREREVGRLDFNRAQLDSLVRLSIVNQESQGVKFRYGVFSAALQAALRCETRGDAMDAIEDVFKAYREP